MTDGWEGYEGRWILVDLTNTESEDWLDGAVIYGPFATAREASDWGNLNCSLSCVSVLEEPMRDDDINAGDDSPLIVTGDDDAN